MREKVVEGKILPYCNSCMLSSLVQEKLQQIENDKENKAKAIKKELFNSFMALLFVGGIFYVVVGIIVGGIIHQIVEGVLDKIGYELYIHPNWFIGVFAAVLLFLTIISTYSEEIRRIIKEKDEAQINEEIKNNLEREKNTRSYELVRFKESIYRQYLYQTSNIRDIDKLEGIAFEDFMASVFQRQGYIVSGTKASGDDGIDLIIETHGRRIGVQCKRYSGNVSVSAVQEVYAGKGMYDCDEALVVTNSYYTHPARRMADKLGVALWDRNNLIEELHNLQKRITWETYLKNYYIIPNQNIPTENSDLKEIIKCLNCKIDNRVLVGKLYIALCGNCRKKLSERVC
ncbi:restriction endonuclease [Paenibacillus sp. YYML68]|uniref:restriction endonuclease n=1 Tax=Paenibacillus sp. YYML68 TaxID=2909250 RepID=UPI00249280D4|nr:restriction endonuclease [Paenibacillus sp. YYML68]